MTLQLTDAAAERVCTIAARTGRAPVLRLAVDGGGCSGFQYRFALADGADAGDAVAEAGGATLVVDPVSLDLLEGARVDYIESLGGAAFRVDNPNASSGCGCGASFAV